MNTRHQNLEEQFMSISSYLDDLQDFDNPYFEQMVNQNKDIDIINFIKHYLNSITGTQSELELF